jgi:hypothetical protein
MYHNSRKQVQEIKQASKRSNKRARKQANRRSSEHVPYIPVYGGVEDVHSAVISRRGHQGVSPAELLT